MRAYDSALFDFDEYVSMTIETDDGEIVAEIFQEEINVAEGYVIRMNQKEIKA